MTMPGRTRSFEWGGGLVDELGELEPDDDVAHRIPRDERDEPDADEHEAGRMHRLRHRVYVEDERATGRRRQTNAIGRAHSVRRHAVIPVDGEVDVAGGRT